MAEETTIDPITGEVLDPDTGLLVDEETEYDLLFPTIPIEDDPRPPEDLEFTLVDDLADFAEDEAEDDFDEEARDEGATWAFDWDSGEFFHTEQGEPERVEGEDAVLEWAMKALNTPRGVFPIYPPEYGCNIHSLIGQALPDTLVYALVGREVRDCLMFHPRITAVEIESITFDESVDRDTLVVTVSLSLDTDDDPVQLDVRF